MAALAPHPEALALYRALAEEILAAHAGTQDGKTEIRQILAGDRPSCALRSTRRSLVTRSGCYNFRSRPLCPAPRSGQWFSSITPRCRWRPRSCTTARACAERPPISTTSTAAPPRVPAGEMVSLETETDRTLFFDLLPLDVGRHRRLQDPGPALHGPGPGLLQHHAQARPEGRRRHRLRRRLAARDEGRQRRVARQSQNQPRRDRHQARRAPARPPVQQARSRQHPLGRGARGEPQRRRGSTRATRPAPSSARASSRRSRRSRG